MIRKKGLLLTSASFLIFFFAGISITFPLIFHLGDLTTGLGDELLIAWIHAWVRHALLTNPLGIFNANILFPYHNTLAYSDIFLTGSLLTFIPVYFIQQPIAANNVSLIVALVCDGFFIYLLSYYLTKDFFASLLAGLLVIFSPATLSYLVHIQVLESFLVPLSLLFFLLFVKKNEIKYLLFTLICFLLQMYNSFLLGYFIVFSLFIILLYQWFEDRRKVTVLFTKRNIVCVLLTLILIIPVAIPYYQVSKEFHYVRDIRDTIHFALQPEDLLYPGDTTRLKSLLVKIPTNKYSQNNEFKTGYVGGVFSLLVLFVFVYTIRFWKRMKSSEKSFFTIALFGLILSLGPLLHLGRQTIHHPFPVPLPYALLYYVIPGFQGLRNTQRWEMLFIIGAAVVIGLVVSRVISKVSLKMKLSVYLILLAGIVGEFYPPTFVSVPQIKDFPKVDAWMATTPPDATFIEMPIYNWNYTPYVQHEMFREYYGTENFQKIVNGYSGFSPPPWQDFIADMHKEFPDNKSIRKIRALGVQYIIVDTKDFDMGYKGKFEKYNGDEVVDLLKKSHSVSQVKKFNDGTYVFVVDVKK